MGASSFPGYTATLDLRSSRIRSGDNLQGVVVFRNTGKVAVRVDSVNPVEVVITLRGTRRIVGIYSGGIAGTGYGPLLSPDQSQTAVIVAGTARCDGGRGSALPPGHYEAVGEVSGPGVTGVGDVPVYFTSIEPVQILPNHT